MEERVASETFCLTELEGTLAQLQLELVAAAAGEWLRPTKSPLVVAVSGVCVNHALGGGGRPLWAGGCGLSWRYFQGLTSQTLQRLFPVENAAGTFIGRQAIQVQDECYG